VRPLVGMKGLEGVEEEEGRVKEEEEPLVRLGVFILVLELGVKVKGVRLAEEDEAVVGCIRPRKREEGDCRTGAGVVVEGGGAGGCCSSSS
jgi:hypothetical protein